MGTISLALFRDISLLSGFHIVKAYLCASKIVIGSLSARYLIHTPIVKNGDGVNKPPYGYESGTAFVLVLARGIDAKTRARFCHGIVFIKIFEKFHLCSREILICRGFVNPAPVVFNAEVVGRIGQNSVSCRKIFLGQIVFVCFGNV